MLYDITEVCKLLQTSSRTLRFYEEKGIISSTKVGLSQRRKYTEEQFAEIRNVLVLRALGLSVKAIQELQSQKTDLQEAVLSKRAEIYASIDARVKEINLLNEALCALTQGKNIFDKGFQTTDNEAEYAQTAGLLSKAIAENDSDLLYRYFSPKLVQYMPKEVFTVVRRDTLAPLGEFVSIERIFSDEKYTNRLYSEIRYTKLGLKITFVFYAGKIDGLWLGYYDTNAR